MTSVSVWGQPAAQKEEKKLKPIEFCSRLSVSANWNKTNYIPKDFEHVQLLLKAGKSCDRDVIIAWTEKGVGPCLFLGHWNDGVVG